MTPLERAARALCAFDRKWEALDQDGQRTYVERACAVLEAIREPTIEMCDATAWEYQKGDMALVRGTARAIWTDMIDAALAEKANA